MAYNDRKRQYQKAYKEKNREKLNEYKRNWARKKRHSDPDFARCEFLKYYKKYSELSLVQKERKRLARKKWRQNHPDEHRAHLAVALAIRNGTLKKTSCFCGEKIVEGHHNDYTKPLEVVWLCKEHHKLADKQRMAKD